MGREKKRYLGTCFDWCIDKRNKREMHKYEGIERYLHINGYIEQLGEIDVRE